MSEPGPQFAIQRIYVKDLSFESPRAPDGFQGQWKPRINLELNSRYHYLGEGSDEASDKDAGEARGEDADKNADNDLRKHSHEVVLSLTVTAKSEADEVLYLVEVQQAGVFLIRGHEGEALARLLVGTCPGILFPYARELVDSILTRGNFPPLMLGPVDFESIRKQVISQQQAQEQGLTVQ